MPTTAPTAGDPSKSFAQVSTTQKEAVESFLEMSQTIFDGIVVYNQELTNFFAGRIVKDIETQQQLLSCESIGDVMKLQSGFLETALSQYSDEAAKLAEIGTNVVKEDFDPVAQHLKAPRKESKRALKQSA